MKNKNIKKEYYTVREFAEILSLSEMTIYRMIKSGAIDADRPGGRPNSQWRIHYLELPTYKRLKVKI